MNNATPISILALLIGFAPTQLKAQIPLPPVSSPGQKSVLSQTIRGVTVTLSDIGWNTFAPSNNQGASSRVFQVGYSVQANPMPHLALNKSLLDYVTAATQTAPDGSALGYGSCYASDLAGRKIAAWITSELDSTRWPMVKINIDVLDPAASIRASGRSVEPIKFFDIPTPTEVDQMTPVHAETVTPLGTRIVVEKVFCSTATGNTHTTFLFRVVPDASAPDLSFKLEGGDKAVDDTGKNLGGGNVNLRSDMPDMIDQKNDPMLYSTSITGIPSSNAQTMQLTLNASETSERLRDDRYYRHFHFLVSLVPSQDKAATSTLGR